MKGSQNFLLFWSHKGIKIAILDVCMITLCIIFANFSPYDINPISQLRNQKGLLCTLYLITQQKQKIWISTWAFSRKDIWNQKTFNNFKPSFVPFRDGHMMTVILSLKCTHAGPPLTKHHLEGVKIPDVSVLLYSLHLWAQEHLDWLTTAPLLWVPK